MTTYYMSMSTAWTNFDVVEGVEKGETDEQYVHHFPLVWFVANRSHPTSHFVILRRYQGLQKHSVFYCHSVFNEMHKYCGGVSSLGYKHKYVPDGGCYVFQLNPKAARMCIFGKEGEKNNELENAAFLLFNLATNWTRKVQFVMIFTWRADRTPGTQQSGCSKLFCLSLQEFGPNHWHQ